MTPEQHKQREKSKRVFRWLNWGFLALYFSWPVWMVFDGQDPKSCAVLFGVQALGIGLGHNWASYAPKREDDQ